MGLKNKNILLVYMPYVMKKVNDRCYAVISTITGKVHSKCATKQKALAQIRLLSDLYYLE
jgi:hypothetical protein